MDIPRLVQEFKDIMSTDAFLFFLLYLPQATGISSLLSLVMVRWLLKLQAVLSHSKAKILVGRKGEAAKRLFLREDLIYYY